MRKIYFLLFTLFSILSTQQCLFGQVTFPAANTNDGSMRQPLGTWFGFERSAMIYTANELNNRGGAITTVGFYVNSLSSPAAAVDVRIYFKPRTSVFTGGTTYVSETTGATLVYGPTTIPAASFTANAWTTIALTAPYFYTGGTDLEVIVETNATGPGNEAQFAKQFRFTNQANTSLCQTWAADNAAPTGAGTLAITRPNIQFGMTVPPCANPLNPGTVVGPTGTICPGAPFTLYVTSASFGTGITFQWQSFDGSVWNDVPGATNSTLTTSTPGQYRRKMTCSGVDAFSPGFTPTVSGAVSTFPWTENFDGLASIGDNSFPPCWFKQNGEWATRDASWTGRNDPRSAPYYLTDSWSATNEFIWTNGFQLTAGTSYDFSFWFAGDNVNGWTGDVFVNGTQGSAGATQLGGSFITTATTSTNGVYAQVKRTFVPATTGVYYFAIRINANGAPFYLGFDDFRLELTPPCSAPTGLNATGVTNIAAVLNWLASVTPPAGGYNWELRTSGAGGSGATGLVQSGTTVAGVLTQNVSGLTPNTQYTFYVSSGCNPPALVSAWSLGATFRTLCNTFNTFPYLETFETTSTTRDCWRSVLETGSTNWTLGAGGGNGGTTTTAHGGTVNAQHFAGSRTNSTAKYVSPVLNLSGMNPAFGAQLTFWYINEDWAGDQNELRVYYRTSPANPWTLIPGAVYTSSVANWTEVELLLPSSTSATYQIAFEGYDDFGWGVGIDDVLIGPAPSCPKPTAVRAFAISTTSAIVNFTAPTGAYVVEYGPVGFTPGTTNLPGGGQVQLGTGSPIQLNGLTANTAYDVYVRRICVPGVDFSLNVKTTVTTLCTAVSVPYLQNFESATAPDMPTCTSMQDVNGNSGSELFDEGGRWISADIGEPLLWVSPVQSLVYTFDAVNSTRPADDWFYLQGLNLTGGQSYRLKFFYKGSDGPNWVERLEVKYGTQAYNAAMTNLLYTNNNIISNVNSPWDSAVVDFTPAATGVYYIGFHAISAADQAYLFMDDISVKVTPLVDVGVVAATVPAVCPGNVAIKARVQNYNFTALNMATRPITVTANFTGPSTATVSTTINTGTLQPVTSAAGDTVTVSLPTANLVSGFYTAVISTSSPDDPETGNNSYTTTFFINPSPAQPAITPAAPLICAGDSVRLETQFVTPAPAPVTVAFRSGNLAVTIPDNSPAGLIQTMAVSGIPANATITRIDVKLTATHTWVADLRFNLKAPNGKILNLFNRKGGINSVNLTNTIITSDPAAPAIPATGVPYTGTFKPDALIGIPANQGPAAYPGDAAGFADLWNVPNGNWTLAVADNAVLDGGRLDSFSITITYAIIYPNITWTPAASLFTNAATTTQYTAGTNAVFVYAEPNVNTTYTVLATTAAGCTSSNTVTVSLRQPAITFIPLPTKICLSDSAINLNAQPLGGTWAGIGVQGNRFLPPRTALGTYNVTYRYVDANNCENIDTLAVKVEDCPERRILLRDNAVIVYPNPNGGEFNIRINSTLYNKLNMGVYNSAGVLIFTQQFAGLSFNRVVPINLKHLPGGTYMVSFNYDGGQLTSEKTFKVVIAR